MSSISSSDDSDFERMLVDAVMNGEARAFVTHSATKSEMEARDLQSLRRFDVPENWTVEGDIIDISPSGVCSGGYISIQNPQGRMAVFQLTPPKCQAVRVSVAL